MVRLSLTAAHQSSTIGGMIVRSVRFDDKLYDKLVTAAEERHVSFAWLVHKMLEEGVERLNGDFRVTT